MKIRDSPPAAEDWTASSLAVPITIMDKHDETNGTTDAVDLSPLTFSQVTWAGRNLRVDPSLTLAPTMDEDSGRLYVLEDSELGIHVFARTRGELADELAEQLFFQWDAYAQEAPDRLSRGAHQLRVVLLARVREMELAAPPESR